MRRLAGIVLGAALLWPASAIADSIVYERDGNVWQAAPDGTNQRQVTTSGGFSKPTQADDGTIVAVKDKLLQRMDRGGRIVNTAGDSSGTGPLTPQLSPGGLFVAYEFLNTGSVTPGRRTALSHASRPTGNDDIFNIGGWGNPSWIGNDRVLMFDASETFTGDTLIYTLGGSTETWFEDPDISMSGGEISAGATRFAATDSAVIRLYALAGPPPAMPEPRCQLTGPEGSFFRPTWSPDAGSLAWQEDSGIWVGSFNLDDPACSGDARLVIPGGKAPDWGPANVSTPAGGPGGDAADTTAPKLTVKAPKRITLRALLRGFTVRVRCSEACRVSGTLLRGKKRIGKGSKRMTKAGTTKLKLRPGKKARRKLMRGKPKSVSVRLLARDGAGNKSKRATRKIAVRK